jgi:hypothetical protein
MAAIAVPAPTRQDTHILTLSVDRGGTVGVLQTGTWDSKEGGEVDSDENKYKPGGMAGEISLGGTVIVGNVTFSRYYDWRRDDQIMQWLKNGVGYARGSLGVQMLDITGAAQGSLMTYGGTLKTVTPPELDSTSNDPAMWSVEFTCDSISFSVSPR